MGENIFKPAGSYSKEDLIKCSEGKLFNPSDGKLPNNEMLMMDRITEVDLKKGDFDNGLIKNYYLNKRIRMEKYFISSMFWYGSSTKTLRLCP